MKRYSPSADIEPEPMFSRSALPLLSNRGFFRSRHQTESRYTINAQVVHSKPNSFSYIGGHTNTSLASEKAREVIPWQCIFRIQVAE